MGDSAGRVAVGVSQVLDEKALRKPGFTDGYPVVMADGQTWTLPKPRFRLKPHRVDGKIEILCRATFGPESDPDLDILYGAVEADYREVIRVKFAMTARLLLSNYDLTDDQLGELIVLEVGDAASDQRWDAINEAMLGIVPKPSPAI
jgi:hypothetical protein